MRQRRPNSNFSLQYDKLIIDHEIYMFNDMTGRVEEVRFLFTAKIKITFTQPLITFPAQSFRKQSVIF